MVLCIHLHHLFCVFFSHELVYDDILLVGNNGTIHSADIIYLKYFPNTYGKEHRKLTTPKEAIIVR